MYFSGSCVVVWNPYIEKKTLLVEWFRILRIIVISEQYYLSENTQNGKYFGEKNLYSSEEPKVFLIQFIQSFLKAHYVKNVFWYILEIQEWT